MTKTLAIATVLAAFVSAQALAQTTAPSTPPSDRGDCAANWNALDLNRDGSLSAAEIEAGKDKVPTSLGSAQRITQQDFMSACNIQAEGQKR